MSLWRVEGGRIRFRPHPGQAAAWRSTRRFVFMLAGTQGGKTSFGPIWLHREVLARGAGDYIAATATFDLFKLKMLPALREWFEHTLGMGRWWAGDRVMELRDPQSGEFWAQNADDPMWGRIILRSAASGGGLESLTAQAAWLDECGQDEFTVEAWEAVLRRLSLSQGRVLGTTTPYNLGWIKTEVHDRWQAGDPLIDVVQFASTLNPQFPPGELERARASMPDWRFRMFYRGELARPAGMVYDCFDNSVHVVEDRDLPPEWPRWIGIDFGAVNTALVWLAENPDTRVFHLYRESLSGGSSTRDHARAAIRAAALENVAGWFGGSPSEEQQRMDWAAEGVPVQQPPVSDVEAGISRVYELLKRKRLYVFRSCRGVLDELGSYRRRLDDAGQPTEEILDKRTFHRLDALRYAVSGATGGAVRYAPAPWA